MNPKNNCPNTYWVAKGDPVRVRHEDAERIIKNCTPALSLCLVMDASELKGSLANA